MTQKTRKRILSLTIALVMVLGFALSAVATNDNDTQLEAPVLREVFQIGAPGVVSPYPRLEWDPVENAVDYMVYAFNVDPDEYPDAEPVARRLASSPVSPDVRRWSAPAIPVLGDTFEFRMERPHFSLMANFFTDGSHVDTNRHPLYSPPTEILPRGYYWFKVRALAADEANNSELSNAVGSYTTTNADGTFVHEFIGYKTFVVPFDYAREIMEAGEVGVDFLFIDLRGPAEFLQQGKIRGAFAPGLSGSGNLDIRSEAIAEAYAEHLEGWDKDKPIFLF